MPAADRIWTNIYNQDTDNPSLVRLTAQGLFLGKIPVADLDATAQLLAAGEPVLGHTIPLVDIKRIEGAAESPALTFTVNLADERRERVTVVLRDSVHRDELLDAIETQLGYDWERVTRAGNRFKEALWPLATAAFLALLTWLMYSEAEDIAGRPDVNPRGRMRHRMVRRLMYWLEEVLGSTGVLILGGLAVGVCLIWLFAALAHVKERIVLQPRFE
jgi:hypothetical protein